MSDVLDGWNPIMLEPSVGETWNHSCATYPWFNTFWKARVEPKNMNLDPNDD